MVISRYAELVEVGKIAIKEEKMIWNDDQVLIRITYCGLCQYDGAYFQGIITWPMPINLPIFEESIPSSAYMFQN
jgi:threonine dehydrogenase-like Zn-dependent dehydrogenase